ncbi:hypothetical protein ELG63_36405 [Rhizobium leguminosarum]|uniref:hypothetical protein n=1 Tax=Rhizobium leguminosarum TaxID=384 RepID=UPI001030974E|nr:hypothetical protein [Rhizobium leguminosarum]TBH28172.1 hypothetical protein ELG63_36405 [Rhizobium leguminosarum]
MADGFKERLKKIIRPAYGYVPGLGRVFAPGGSFMSQEDYGLKYGHTMPQDTWSERAWISRKPRWDELDTPENRAALSNAQWQQEHESAFHMGRLINADQLKALYKQGRVGKLAIDTGGVFSIEYNEVGTPTHVNLDFGGGDVWRSRVGLVFDEMSKYARSEAAKQSLAESKPVANHRDQVRAAVFSPVLDKLKVSRDRDVYDFLTQVEAAPRSVAVSPPKAEDQAETQSVRQVNVLRSHYISHDGSRNFESLKGHPAALRGHPDDTGLSPRVTQLSAIRDVLRAEPEAMVSNQSAALGQPGETYYLSADGSELRQTSMVKDHNEEIDDVIDQPYDRSYEIDSLKEIGAENEGVEWKQIDALEKGFEPDDEQAALRLEVVERLREGDRDTLNFEGEGVSFHLDGDNLIETWTDPDQSFAWDANKCDVPLFATESQDQVLTLQQVEDQALRELLSQSIVVEQTVQEPAIEATPVEIQDVAAEQAEADALKVSPAYLEERERAVQEQVRENLEAGVMEETDLYADYDNQTIEQEQAVESEAARERNDYVAQLYSEAEQQHAAFEMGNTAVAIDLSVTPNGVEDWEWKRAADNSRLEQEAAVEVEQAHIQPWMYEGQETRVDMVSQLREEPEGTVLRHDNATYMLKGDELLERTQHAESEGWAIWDANDPLKLIDSDYKREQDVLTKFGHPDAAEAFYETLDEVEQEAAQIETAEVETVSAVEAPNRSELLNTLKTSDIRLEQVEATEKTEKAVEAKRPSSWAEYAKGLLDEAKKEGTLRSDVAADLARQESKEKSKSRSKEEGEEPSLSI